MEKIEVRRRGMLTTGEWCNPVSNMLHHVYICVRGVGWGLGKRVLRIVVEE